MNRLSVVVWLGALGLASCGPAKPEPMAPAKIRTTYRILAGVSMGAIGGTALGLSRPEEIDGVAALGGPLDAAFFTRMLDSFVTGGFCPRERLAELARTTPTALNDPAIINACARPHPTLRYEHAQDFNHWHGTVNGGTFDRNSYGNLVMDLFLAYGNMFTHNPDSPFAPPGVPAAHVRQPPANFCTAPVRVPRLFNAEYNPDGAVDAITFCDGQPRMYFCRTAQEPVDFCSDPRNVASPLPLAQEQAFADTYCQAKGGAVLADKRAHQAYFMAHMGDVDPCRAQPNPVRVMLAYDFNGNGRRDFGEPVVNNGQERFDDVGQDGCADDREDGKGGCTATGATGDPNKDNFELDTNFGGTQGNWRRDDGEPFRDVGLDGVPSTGDFGEGNGQYDLSPGRQKLWALDGRSNFTKLDVAGRARLNFLGDGGLRDIFNFGLMAKHVFQGIAALRSTPTAAYRDFSEIPGMKDRNSGAYSPWMGRWSSVPRDLLVFYGAESPTEAQRLAGDGDHVGTNGQVLERFGTVFNWSAATWPSLPKPPAPLGGSSFSARQRSEAFLSTSLGAKWEYAVALPAGYDAPENVEARYPVVYLLHGYGMEPSDFSATAVVADAFATDPQVRFRPTIYVFPYGKCCFLDAVSGARECREKDDQGRAFEGRVGWARECNQGTFWINRSGYTSQDATKYGDALFELMGHIDRTYRTLPAADVEAR